MARVLERQKVILLRQQGKTYREILSEVSVSKSTLSAWLRRLPLTQEQMFQLEINKKRQSYLGREKTSITKQLKYQKRLDKCFREQKRTWLPLTKRELYLAGLFLYWGEGGKTSKGTISISNTDPNVIAFSLIWMIYALDIPKVKIRILVHLYDDMNIEESLDYWSNLLSIPRTQFIKPYIKQSKKAAINYKGHGHGTCMLRYSNVVLREKVIMSIKAMSDYISKYIPEL